MLMVLFVALEGPESHHRRYAEEGENLVGDARKTAAADEDGADGVDEVVHGVVVVGNNVLNVGFMIKIGDFSAKNIIFADKK